MIKSTVFLTALSLIMTTPLYSEECKTGTESSLSCLEGVAEKLKKDDIIESTGICKHSWSEKPGYADYTLKDNYSKTTVPSKHGRTKENSLLANKTLPTDMCERAKALMPCFEKAFKRDEPLLNKFKAWAKQKQIDPIRAMLALSYKETKSGQVEDKCYGKSCNGIGLMQIITAFDKNGKMISNSSPEWAGITHNVLTNIEYSIRVLAIKVKEVSPTNLYDLSRDYNGSSTKHEYAGAVRSYYSKLTKCGVTSSLK